MNNLLVQPASFQSERNVVEQELRQGTFGQQYGRLLRLYYPAAAPPGIVGGMTNRKYANLTKSSAPTAQRDLAELVALGCLVPAGAGRSARYELPSAPPD